MSGTNSRSAAMPCKPWATHGSLANKTVRTMIDHYADSTAWIPARRLDQFLASVELLPPPELAGLLVEAKQR